MTIDLPDMSCQMLAPSEAEIAGRKVGAEEALAFLLLGRSPGLIVHTLGVGPVLAVVGVVHVHILRSVRLSRALRVLSGQAPGVRGVDGSWMRREAGGRGGDGEVPFGSGPTEAVCCGGGRRRLFLCGDWWGQREVHRVEEGSRGGRGGDLVRLVSGGHRHIHGLKGRHVRPIHGGPKPALSVDDDDDDDDDDDVAVVAGVQRGSRPRRSGVVSATGTGP